MILHRIREVFSAIFGRDASDLGLRMVYDVAHNTAKLETHTVSIHGHDLQQRMEQRGIYVHTVSYAGLAEEAAYKDIDAVVEATERAGLSRPVVRFTPVGNVKG